MSTLFPIEYDVDKGAEFSPCRVWRYRLWRTWNASIPAMVLIGLNPSIADEAIDDPTIRRCISFAQEFGYGGLMMLNAYGFCATDPWWMKAAPEPVGAGNDAAIASETSKAALIIAAWGVHCSAERASQVLKIVGKTVHCLGRTKHGHPRHPLYLRADTKPEVFWNPSSGVQSDGESQGKRES